MRTILYAEDNPDDAFFMRRAFDKAGLPERLVIVPDGKQAVNYVLGIEEYSDRAAHPPPALVLLDLKMPILTGLEALRAIRSDQLGSKLPVALLTSSTNEADIADAKTSGANGYFVKPGNGLELAEFLKTVATISARADAPATQRWDVRGNHLPAIASA